MPRTGAGTFVRTDGVRTSSTLYADQKALGIKVRADFMDVEQADMGDEITNSLALDGQSTMSGSLKMGGNAITGLASADAAGEAIAYAQDNVQFQSSDAGSGYAGTIDLHRNSASPADSDLLYRVAFSGQNSGGGQITYAALTGIADDVTSSTEDGGLILSAMVAGTLTERMRIDETGIKANAALDTDGNNLTLGGGDLDTEGGDINLNGGSLIGGTATPGPGALDLNGDDLTIDADGDTTLSASSDDTVVLSIGPTPTTLVTFTSSAMTMTNAGNIDLNGGDLILDADGDTYVHCSADDEFRVVIGGSNKLAIGSNFTVLGGANFDLDGNRLVLDADQDTHIESTTDDRIDFATSGTDRLQIGSSQLDALLDLDMNTNDILDAGDVVIGKSSTDGGATAGTELLSSGRIIQASNDSVPITINRRGYTSGTVTLMSFRVNGTVVGDIIYNGTSLSFSATDWAEPTWA